MGCTGGGGNGGRVSVCTLGKNGELVKSSIHPSLPSLPFPNQKYISPMIPSILQLLAPASPSPRHLILCERQEEREKETKRKKEENEN